MENKWMERGRTGETGGMKQNKEREIGWNGEAEYEKKNNISFYSTWYHNLLRLNQDL